MGCSYISMKGAVTSTLVSIQAFRLRKKLLQQSGDVQVLCTQEWTSACHSACSKSSKINCKSMSVAGYHPGRVIAFMMRFEEGVVFRC